MKVLEKGVKGWSKEMRCSGKGNGGGGCKAKLLVEYADLFQTRESDFTGGGDLCVTFECPICGVWTDLPDASFRSHVAELPFRGGSEQHRKKEE
jgi:hypothetical protein